MNTTPPNEDNVCDAPQAVTNFDDAMKLIGDFWTLRIVDAIRSGELRFCEIERAIPSANPTTLTGRLKRLEEAGVIERREETVDKQSVTYLLTDQGMQIIPIVDAIKTYTVSYSGRR